MDQQRSFEDWFFAPEEEEGYLAAKEGKPRDENPHDATTDSHHDWDIGWLSFPQQTGDTK